MVIKKTKLKHKSNNNKTNHNKTNHNKTNHNKTNHNSKKTTKNYKIKNTGRIRNNKNNKNNKNKNDKNIYPAEFKLTEKQIELLLFISSIVNHFLFLMKNDIPKPIIKETMINLFKDLRNHNHYISNKTTDIQIDAIFNNLYSEMKKLKKQIDKEYKNNKILKHSKTSKKYSKTSKKYNKTSKKYNKTSKKYNGGFYFKSLEEKADQPLTGNDLATLLDEIQQFIYNAQYTDEGKFLQDTNAVISMFRGDLGQFKGLVQYKIFPQYYQIMPPFLKWDNIMKAIRDKKYEDIPDYLLAYQSYLRSRDEYLVAKGLKSPSVLQGDRYTGFFDKIAHSLDKNITQFQQYRNKLTGKISPIALPV
jgi:hypothetical protein